MKSAYFFTEEETVLIEQILGIWKIRVLDNPDSDLSNVYKVIGIEGELRKRGEH
jgi:hypothetical protein